MATIDPPSLLSPAAGAGSPLLTEEQIQARLAGETVRGPRFFRGRELASYSAALKLTTQKVVRPDDPATLHDVILLYVLAEAHGSTTEERIAKRRALITATDDVEGFRARVSVEHIDELTNDELREARALVDDILTPVQLAAVAVSLPAGLGTKKKDGAKTKPHRTK